MCPQGPGHGRLVKALSSPPGLMLDPQPQSVSLFHAKNTGADTRPRGRDVSTNIELLVQNNEKSCGSSVALACPNNDNSFKTFPHK